MTNFKILEYRSPDEVASVLKALNSITTRDEFGRPIAVEHRVTVPRTHTGKGKGQRRRRQEG